MSALGPWATPADVSRAFAAAEAAYLEPDYTPGPWVHIPNEKFRPGAVLVWTAKGPGHGAICELSGPNGYAETMAQHEANARLIAAAPDLLAAAEEVMGRSYLISPVTGRQLCVECSVYVGEEHSADCYIPALRAAIKKAKGQ